MRLTLILLFLHLLGNVEVSLSQNVCSEIPDVPHAHVSDETQKAEYQQGDVIYFTCETGYISGPTIRYVCSQEGWLAVHQGKCYLKPCQLPDDTPNGYFQITHGGDFVFGTTIKYFCNEGYQMMSKIDTRICLLDGWTNHVPICDPLSCDPPPADEEITVKGLPDNDEPILPDRFLTFSCDAPGTHLKGRQVLTCGKDGQWDSPFPSCEPVTCEAEVMHSHLSAVGLPPANETMRVGHRLGFYCTDDYKLEGSAEIQCLQNGRWSAPFPMCIDKCKITGVPQSVRIYSYNSGTHLTKGQKLRFSCWLRGHLLHGKAEVECLANGQWSDPFPTCGPPLGCGRPPPLANGDTKESIRFVYRHNDRVEYTCQNLYIIEGGAFKTCHNGEWLGETKCIRPCTVDTDIMNRHNIRFRFTRNNKLYATHDEEIEFTCTYGHRPVGIVEMRQKCIDGVMPLPSCQ